METIKELLGTILVLGFALSTILTALIKRYVDPEKARPRPDLQKLFSSTLLPRDVLTKQGAQLWLCRNYAAAMTLLCAVVLIIWYQIIPYL